MNFVCPLLTKVVCGDLLLGSFMANQTDCKNLFRPISLLLTNAYTIYILRLSIFSLTSKGNAK